MIKDLIKISLNTIGKKDIMIICKSNSKMKEEEYKH